MTSLFEGRPRRIETGMLIRRPRHMVFEAFVEPALTTKFWFTRSTGRLEAGRDVEWHWDMFGASASVTGKAVEPHERILYAWGLPESRTDVEILFAEHGSEATFVTASVNGFVGSDAEVVRQMVDAMGGFTNVLAGAKAYLEHGVELGLVVDRYPGRHS